MDPVTDPADAYAGDVRTPPADRPWVLANMVASVDGAMSVDGLSGAMGGPADRHVFAAIRAVADVIVVGAGTVRAENYGPPRLSEQRQRQREARGQARLPRLAVISGRLDLAPTARVFDPAGEPPLVVTGAGADPERRAALAGVAEVVEIADAAGRLDLAAAVGHLGRQGARVVLCEGGPSLLAQLAAEDLLDELCLTLAPLLVGGDARRIVGDAGHPTVRHLQLDRVQQAGDVLFLRYVRDPQG